MSTKEIQRLTIAKLVELFLKAKRSRMEAGELSPRTLVDLEATCALVHEHFGGSATVAKLKPNQFAELRDKMVKWAPSRKGNVIVRVRSIFKFAFVNDLIDKPIRFGSEFSPPSARTIRKHKNGNPKQCFSAAEIRRMLDNADVPLRAMILLGVNAGLGNNDCAHLNHSHLNLSMGWLTFPRPKTETDRRAWLWPETRLALAETIASQPEPVGRARDEQLVFVSRHGGPMLEVTRHGRTDLVRYRFNSLLKRLALARKGCGFYSLRHIHRTVSDGARDPVASDLIMGHVDNSMANHYRNGIDDSRVKAVCEFVRKWLFVGPWGEDR